MDTVLETIGSLHPIANIVLIAIGTLVFLASFLVPFVTSLTPSKDDDDLWERWMKIPILGPLVKAFTSFSLFRTKK